ncbi:polysaccharide pyruvyl transferase [Novosphingobium fuchskuhlense]|uniref:Polysaccharide pyruvyl transferase n=1 Tax=Novosphingobium fuchskuhlense TaxID=1117702 RepID=A0A124JTP7_9SPHN|nr:polysaccharide pyruvyl transferase family protein [Novosphingobium fuchskuhlense]KUR70398.1 polysaccharide pyruvyl transferase [Novosphingobium fuchskuhlense]
MSLAEPPSSLPSSSPPSPPRRIALLNVKYSPNLGDGLLSECLEAELARTFQTIAPGTEVFSIDLAGRRAYPPIAPSRRAAQIAVLEALPASARRLATRIALAALVHLRLRRHVRTRLAGCDAVVLGGGNLLTDADLNFPMKIAGALDQAARLRLPAAVYGVGANRQWSAAGKRLFGRALGRAKLAYAAVRDARSQAAWRDLLVPQGVRPAALSGDPGLLASCHFPRPPLPFDAPVAGLCVTAPMALRYHATGPDGAAASAACAALDAWYATAARALVDAGFRVALFTNGSPEDRDYLHAMGPDWILSAKGPVTMTNPFADPAEMIRFIAGCQLIVAHRMHACIAAHSFAIPTIGLRWDVKLDSFFALAGRGQFIADTASLDGPALTALARQAAAEGVDRAALEALIAGTRGDIARMAAALARAMQPIGPSGGQPVGAAA